MLKRFQSTLTKQSTFSIKQSPNRITTWSTQQNSKEAVLNHAKFVQKDLSKQPMPYAAIELIAKEPVRIINDRIAVCQGNKQEGQGHPKVYINLDNPKVVGTCGYCGLRFSQQHH